MNGRTCWSAIRRPLLCLPVALAVAGCTEDLGASDDGEFADDDGLHHLGRVHVLLQPTETEPSSNEDVEAGDSASLSEVTARFAYFQGLEEGFVRTQVDMLLVPSEILEPGECIATNDLLTFDPGIADAEHRELLLMDAGALRVDVAGNELEVPVSLVPDLLPYMSGMEYRYFGNEDSAPVLDLEQRPATVDITAEGSSEALPHLDVAGRIPAPMGLDAGLGGPEDRVLVAWWSPQESEASEPAVFRFTAFDGDAVLGNEITCVFPDQGSLRVDLGDLWSRDLATEIDGMRIEMSRLDRTLFDAGSFVDGELVVELREDAIVSRD